MQGVCLVCGKEADKYTKHISLCYPCRVARWTAKDYKIENIIWHHCPGYKLCTAEKYYSPPTIVIHLKIVPT
jgi:hypothetical protein